MKANKVNLQEIFPNSTMKNGMVIQNEYSIEEKNAMMMKIKDLTINNVLIPCVKNGHIVDIVMCDIDEFMKQDSKLILYGVNLNHSTLFTMFREGMISFAEFIQSMSASSVIEHMLKSRTQSDEPASDDKQTEFISSLQEDNAKKAHEISIHEKTIQMLTRKNQDLLQRNQDLALELEAYKEESAKMRSSIEQHEQAKESYEKELADLRRQADLRELADLREKLSHEEAQPDNSTDTDDSAQCIQTIDTQVTKDTFRVYVNGVCQFMFIDHPHHVCDSIKYMDMVETLERCETFAEYVGTLINGYYEKGCEVYIGRMPLVMKEPYDKKTLLDTVLKAYDSTILNSSFYPVFSKEPYNPTLREVGKSIHMLARFKNSDGKYIGSQVITVDAPAVMAAKCAAKLYLGKGLKRNHVNYSNPQDEDIISSIEIDCGNCYDELPQFTESKILSVGVDNVQKAVVISDLRTDTAQGMPENSSKQSYALHMYSAKDFSFQSTLVVLPSKVSLDDEIRKVFNVVSSDKAEMCIEAYNANNNSFISRWYLCEK